MTSQKRRTKEIFMTPTTSEQSLSYLRNVTVAFVSQICYLRKLFPDDTFDTRTIDSLQIRSFKKDKTNAQLSDILKALSIGIEKSAIESITLNIMADEEILESYTISIKDMRDSVNKDHLRSSVEKLFENLDRAVEGLDKVPNNSCIFFNVASEKDKWGSQDSFTETKKRKYQLQKYKIGKLNTGFHAADFTYRK
ncbi:hypothetical protein LSTR_LSTR007425 [Laodelphax striatellus]|uniref:HORMA domain-containing protein n=1 Tax=Laodelphax striatellus TaxID=195883 RepID=A0A482XQ14_LAOST|nr:hypothetical protein LSTR_LSTR007425 [Laodelphax striatellus]